MDPRTVYTKAAKGVMELKNKSNRLPRDLLNVLKLIDGKSSVDQILEKSDRLSENQLHQALEKLVNDGFIKIFMSGTELGAMEELDFTISPIIGSHQKKKEKTPEKPKQENVSDSDSDAKRKALATAKAEMANKLKAAREMRAQADADRKRTEVDTKAKQEAEAKARADMAAKIKADQQIEIRRNAIQESMQIEEIEVTPLTQLSQLGVDLGADTITDTKANEDLEAKFRAGMEVKAIAEAEKRRQEDEAKAKSEAEARARAEMANKVKAEFEAKQRAEAEAKARREAEEKARREAEERARREAAEKAKREAEEKARREAEEKARREAEERARREAAEKAKREAEEKARQEAEARARREAAEKAKREADERARREAAEKAKREAEEKARQEAEARARADAAERLREEERIRTEAKSLAETEQRTRQEEEARARAAAKEKARANAEADAKTRIEAEEKSRQEAEARARADAKTRAEMEAKSKADARARAEAEAESRVKARADQEAKAAEDERKRIAAEAKARVESEARSRAEIQARAKAEAWAEQEARARVERDATRRTEEEEKTRLATLAKMKKKSVNWPKTIIFSLVLLIGVGIAFIQFAPFNVYIPRIENLASERIGEPVIIRSMHVSLIPLPHLKLEGVTIGKSPETKVNTIKVMFEPFSLLNDIKVLKSVEFENVNMPEETLPKALAWSKPNKNQSFLINQIKLKDTKIEFKNIKVPSFEGTFDLTNTGELKRASVRTSDTRLNALITPQGGQNFEIELKASDWQPPLFKIPFVFTELTAKATANKEGMTINEIESRFYGGVVKGSANVKWNNHWQLDGMFDIARLDLAEIFHVFTKEISASGRMNAILTYNTQSETLNTLFDSPKADASFNIQKGSISSIDLIQAMQSTRDVMRGGQTQFNDFSGNMTLSDDNYQFKQLKLTSGLLNATGNVDISPDREFSGRITAQLRTKSTFVFSGNIKGPVLRRR